jgi:8-oxo-dGTP diphosphatase
MADAQADPTHGRFTVVPAAYVFVLRDGAAGREVLLQLRQNTGYMDDMWAAAAAGHVERGETAYDAAHREAAEELGIGGLDLRFELTMHRTAHDLPIDERVDFFFTATTFTGEARIMEPRKCADLRWFPLHALPDPMVPHEAHALASVGTGTPYLTFGFRTAREEH